MQNDWLIWQLADSAFPAGGFAHSAGLEAARQLGEVDTPDRLTDFLKSSLLQNAHAAIPFANAASLDLASVHSIDQHCDAFLSNHVANKASRAQGQGFLAASAKTFPLKPIQDLRDTLRRLESPGHWPVLFGAVCGLLQITGVSLARLNLFITLRSQISAAVRLGIVGPLQGQQIQFSLTSHAESLAQRSAAWGLDQVAQTSPVIDVIQALHDRLYSKLFVS